MRDFNDKAALNRTSIVIPRALTIDLSAIFVSNIIRLILSPTRELKSFACNPTPTLTWFLTFTSLVQAKPQPPSGVGTRQELQNFLSKSVLQRCPS